MSPRTCLITGASRGLGEYLAQAFWNEGWDLALVARDHVTLSKVVANLPKRLNQNAKIFICDFSKPQEVQSLVSRLIQELGQLSALINNAAIHGPIGQLLDNNLTLWGQAIQINLLTPVVLCQGLIPLMDASGGGSIINLSGGGATAARANFTAYASAKTALVRFSETLSEELLPQNIRVNCIAPGAMKTALLEEVVSSGANFSGKREFEIAEKVIAEGGASMDKVADLALFLASSASIGITGKLISAVWDNWSEWPSHLEELSKSDAYTLRRITGRDRGFTWGDK